MQIGYFVEQLYSQVPEEEIIKNGAFFGVPNRYFDPQVGAQLYHRYISEHLEAERQGFDMLVLNEHHANPAVPFHALPELHRREREKLKAVAPGYVAFHREWQQRLTARDGPL